MFCSFIKRIDLYGKDPEFYFKGKPNKTTWVGRILTILYIIIYLAFLIYKLERMVSRVDVTFYDTYAYTGEIPSIELNKEIFYGAFAFDIPGTNIPYADESIYHINAKFVSQVKINGQWNVTERHVPFKHCELSDFGSKYQSIVGNRDLSGMYCPTDVNFVLEGYTTLDRYSYIKLNFAPCRPGEGVECADPSILYQYLYATSIDSIIEDIELTPRDHDNPIQQLERDVPGPTYLELYQMIYVYMQLVIIETDDNIIGFEALSNTDVQKHLKYETSWIISRPLLFDKTVFDPDEPAEDLNDITIQLSPNVLTQKRTYVQLIDVLGDVGGLMEIVNMVFNVICSFIVNILYEKSLVNNLFNFDLDKKLVILKERNLNKSKYEKKEGNKIKIRKKSKNIENPQNNEEGEKNEENPNINQQMNNENVSIKKKRRSNSKKDLYNSQSNVEIYQRKTKSSKRNIYDINEDKVDYLNDMNAIQEGNEQPKIEENEDNPYIQPEALSKNIVKKIKVNKFYIHCGFCCVRSVSNTNNTLLDEGMKLIVEQLDVFNIFRKLYIEAKREKELKDKSVIVDMTDECKKNLAKILIEMNNNSSSISE